MLSVLCERERKKKWVGEEVGWMGNVIVYLWQLGGINPTALRHEDLLTRPRV